MTSCNSEVMSDPQIDTTEAAEEPQGSNSAAQALGLQPLATQKARTALMAGKQPGPCAPRKGPGGFSTVPQER